MAPADHTHGGPFRSAPSWPGRVAAAHTVAREILGVTRARLDTEQAAKISVPVLLLIGEKARTPQSAKLARSQPRFRMRGCWCCATAAEMNRLAHCAASIPSTDRTNGRATCPTGVVGRGSRSTWLPSLPREWLLIPSALMIRSLRRVTMLYLQSRRVNTRPVQSCLDRDWVLRSRLPPRLGEDCGASGLRRW